jgi:predicted RNA binding protein YcfA (HicA-like mRNA interferase family)
MPKFYSGRQVVKALRKADFVVVSQKGSHIKLRGIREGKLQTVIVPNHKELAVGTFSSILKQAAMTRKEFEYFL